MTINILSGDDRMNPTELRFFLAGPSGEIRIADNPTDWLDDLTWQETAKQMVAMESLPPLKGIYQYFLKNHVLFRKIFDSIEPQNEPMPGEWDTKLNSF